MKEHMKMVSKSNEETMAIAQGFLNIFETNAGKNGYSKAFVVGLSGDLGSGKTTFSQCVAELLGITERVTSPTFVIEKIYKTGVSSEKDTLRHSAGGTARCYGGNFHTFIHIDAYRLEGGTEIETLGFGDMLNNKNTLVFIEWPEKIKDAMPEDSINLKFVFIDDTTREISY